MKKVNLSAALFASITIFNSCEKCYIDCNLIAAKIIRYDCDRVIFQLVTTDNIGDTNWEDVQTGHRYNNVVSYYNSCRIAELTNWEKSKLYVSFKRQDNHASIPSCVQCQALSPNPPHTKVNL